MPAAPDPVSEDLDAELEELFDAPSSPPPNSRPIPEAIPESPQKAVPVKKQRSILDALVANRQRLSAAASSIVSDIDKLSEQAKPSSSSTLQTKQPSDEPKLKNGKPSIREEMAARRYNPKPAPSANAFKVHTSTDPSSKTDKIEEYHDDKYSNMSLTQPSYPQHHLSSIFGCTNRVDIAHLPNLHTQLPSLRPYIIYACLVRKNAKKTASNESMYAVWTLCNMPRSDFDGKLIEPTTVTFLLFDKAYQKFHTTCAGAVFALRNASMKPPREREGSERGGKLRCCVSISRPDDIVFLGVCKDYKLCDEVVWGGGVCGQWYDANRMVKCVKHSRIRQKRLTTGSRMDVNNAPRVSLAIDVKAVNGPKDISNLNNPAEDDIGHEEVNLQKRKDHKNLKRLKASMKRSGKTGSDLHGSGQRNIGRNAQRTSQQPPIGGIQDSVRQTLAHRHVLQASRERNESSTSITQSTYEQTLSMMLRLGYVLQGDGSWKPNKDDINAKGLTLITRSTHASQKGRLVKRPRNANGEVQNVAKRRKAPESNGGNIPQTKNVNSSQAQVTKEKDKEDADANAGQGGRNSVGKRHDKQDGESQDPELSKSTSQRNNTGGGNIEDDEMCLSDESTD